MLTTFVPADNAGRWQISSPGILGSAPMEGALNITLEAGIERIRKVSLSLTAFLSGSLETRLISKYPDFRIITPQESSRRGGHIAVEHPHAPEIYQRLLARGVITDLRPPNILRIAPVPLYNTFSEIYKTVSALLEIDPTL